MKTERKTKRIEEDKKLREEAWRLYCSVTASPNAATPDYAPPSIITGVDQGLQAIHLLILANTQISLPNSNIAIYQKIFQINCPKSCFITNNIFMHKI